MFSAKIFYISSQICAKSRKLQFNSEIIIFNCQEFASEQHLLHTMNINDVEAKTSRNHL